MSSVIDSEQPNQRAFPRISVSCPVLYLLPPAKRWQVATLMDFSAIGISMVCDDLLDVGTDIEIQIKPGSQKTVPAVSAAARVVRCETSNEQRYIVSCKLIKVHR